MFEALPDLHFLRTEFLWLLPLILVIGLVFRSKLTHEHSLSNLVDADLLAHLLDNPENLQQNKATQWRRYAILATAVIAVVALAGPAWEKQEQPVFKRDDTLIVIADLTLSMHAQDVSPSRLTRMRYKLLELLKHRKEGLTALIAYSGDAHVVSPLSDDSNTISALVPALSPEIMPSIGSNPVAAFKLANELFEQASVGKKRIAWFTDGINANQISRIKKLVDTSAADLVIVGIGTKQGGPIPLPSGKFLKESSGGKPVTARFDSSRLIDLAGQTGGVYMDLRSDNRDIEIINATDETSSSLQKAQKAENNSLEFEIWLDRGAWLIPLLLPGLLMCFRRGWILTVSIFFIILNQPTTLYAQENNLEVKPSPPISLWNKLWKREDQLAYDSYQTGKYSEASELFSSDDWRGTAHFRGGEYQAAEQAFGDAIERITEKADSKGVNDQQELANNYYNQGHALAHNGKLEKALAAYDKALEQNKDFKEAAQAKQIVESLLEKQREQQQNQQSEQEKSTEKNQNQEQEQEQQDHSGGQSHTNDQSSQQNKPSGSQQDSPHGVPQEESQQDSQERQSQKNEQQRHTDDANTPTQGENNDAAGKQNKAQSATEDKEPGQADEQTANTAQMQEDNNPGEAEQDAELQQWLRKVENDPAGLLRRKFDYERKLREREGTVINDEESAQLW